MIAYCQTFHHRGHGWSGDCYVIVLSRLGNLLRRTSHETAVQIGELESELRSEKLPKEGWKLFAPFPKLTALPGDPLEWLRENITGKCVIQVRDEFGMDMQIGEVLTNRRWMVARFENAADAVKFKLVFG